jgi:hypothetical protein
MGVMPCAGHHTEKTLWLVPNCRPSLEILVVCGSLQAGFTPQRCQGTFDETPLSLCGRREAEISAGAKVSQHVCTHKEYTNFGIS